jgi:hypothetical protein
MATEKKETKKEAEAKIVAAGRKHLRAWLLAAEKHRTIYYTIDHVSRSGTFRTIKLATIKRNAKGKAELVALWPGADYKALVRSGAGNGDVALDVIAKDWGFSFKRRAFEAHGCGIDMVFATVYKLAGKAFPYKATAKPSDRERPIDLVNKIRREAF